jgi:putative flippase GtrA
MVRLKGFSYQFIRYFIVAFIGYCFDFGTLIILHELLSVHYLIAASCGFVLGLVVVYILSSKYVFGESKIKSKSTEFGLFALIGVIGLGILNILMWVFTDIFLVNYIVSKVFATVFVYVWNFLARRSLYHDQPAN